MRKLRMLAAGAALALLVSACQPGGSVSPSQSSGSPSTPAELPTAVIGSANFDEAAVVAEIYAQALEAAGFTVERNLYTGPRETTLPALESGELNLMPEYIGSLLSVGFWARPPATRTRRSPRCRTSCRRGLTAFDYAPGADQNAFAVTSETAESLDIATLTDAAAVAGDLTWGLPPECETRPTCGAGLSELYGIDIASIAVETIDPAVRPWPRPEHRGRRRRAALLDAAGDHHLQPRRPRGRPGSAAGGQHGAGAHQELADAGGDLLESTLNDISMA